MTLLTGLAIAGAAFAGDVTVGLLLDEPADEARTAALVASIQALAPLDAEVRTTRRTGDGTVASVRTALAALQADPDVAIVVAFDPIGSHLAATGAPAVPTLAVAVVDPAVQGLPRGEVGTGVADLGWLAAQPDLAADLQRLRQLTSFDEVAVLVPAALADAWPDDAGARLDALVAPLGVEARLVAVDGPLPDLDGVDAAWLAPGLPDDVVQGLLDGLADLRIPSFAAEGHDQVARGALAGVRLPDADERLRRQVAVHVQLALEGDALGSLPVDVDLPGRLALNLTTAREVGVSVPWGLLLEADPYGSAIAGEPLGLAEVVSAAMADHLLLEVRRQAVAARAAAVDEARGGLLPSVGVGLRGATIDRDRAEASFGVLPQTTLTAGVTLEQPLYVDGLWAQVTVARHLAHAEESGLAALKLDVGRDAAVAWLGLVRADGLLDVRRSDLGQVRQNLDAARRRQAIGAGGPGEVYRAEAELASAREQLWHAFAGRQQAEIRLNQALHRPLRTAVAVDPGVVDDAGLSRFGALAERYASDPRRFTALTDFLVAEGQDNAPELAGFDARLRAQERVVSAERRTWTHPTVGLSGSLSTWLVQAGGGSDSDGTIGPFALDPLEVDLGEPLGAAVVDLGQLGPFELGFDPPDDVLYQVGVDVGYPVFNGGARRAAVRGAEADRLQVVGERARASEQLEAWTRAAAIATSASWHALAQSERRAEAAADALDLVRSAYLAGTVPQIDLLAAQSAALLARLGAADARFRFFADLVELQRSMGRLVFAEPQAAQDAWVDRLEAWFAGAGFGGAR